MSDQPEPTSQTAGEKIQSYFNALPSSDTSRLVGMQASYKFDIANAGQWHVSIQDNNITVTQEDQPADCTIQVQDTDFVNILEGTLNTQMAFMSGQLLIEGDMGLAMKLSAVL